LLYTPKLGLKYYKKGDFSYKIALF
jgi:hypothetical protein